MDIILERRSIRKFENKLIEPEKLEYLLRAAMHAPSAMNLRPWEFIVIDKRETMNRIAEEKPYSQMLVEAPLCLAVCCRAEMKERSKSFWVQDCAAATQNILLAAMNCDLGAVWLGVYPGSGETQIKEIVGIPQDVTLFSLVAVGYPAEEKEFIDRYDASLVHNNKW